MLRTAHENAFPVALCYLLLRVKRNHKFLQAYTTLQTVKMLRLRKIRELNFFTLEY